jgi:hypothetical protein
MSVSQLPLIASAAFLLATAGCTMEKLDRVDGPLPALQPAIVVAEPAGGQELHAMFDAQKREAVASELPAQF